jgi:hypothetical protein
VGVGVGGEGIKKGMVPWKYLCSRDPRTGVMCEWPNGEEAGQREVWPSDFGGCEMYGFSEIFCERPNTEAPRGNQNDASSAWVSCAGRGCTWGAARSD